MTDPWHSCSQMFYLLLQKFLVKYLFFFFNPFWLQYFIGVCMNHFSHDKKFCKVLTSTFIQFFACVIISNWLFFLSEAQHWLHVFWSHFGNQLFIVFWFITALLLFCLSHGVHHVVWLPRPLKWLLVTFTEFTGSRLSRNPSSGKVWIGFLLHPILPAVCNTILLFGDFGIGSTNNPLIDIFLILITCWCEVVLIL